jgi:thioredoxin-dependent peroxiredoxin
MTPQIGKPAPLFEAQNQDGETIKLSDFLGKKVVLYFYPKDSTPKCTDQACNLRDNYDALLGKGMVVIGVSADSAKSHKKFIKKYELPFDLLVDEEHELCEKYGVWVEKSMYGKKFMGVFRTTFVIDEKGIITEIIDKIDANDHANQIM